MKLKKCICSFVVCSMAFMGLTGCQFQTSKSLVFNVETGDKIEVKLDTTDKHTLSHEDNIFEIKKDDKLVLKGIFITKDIYDIYLNNIHTSKQATIIEDKLEEEEGYLFYKADVEDGSEYDCIFMVKDANTGILLGSNESEEVAKEAMDKLTITAKD